MVKIKKTVIIVFISLLLTNWAFSQIGRGSPLARRTGKHNGNQVFCTFTNMGYTTWNAWKYEANGYVIDIQPLVGVRLPIRDYRVNGLYDGIPDTLTSVICCNTHGGDFNPSGSQFWGFEPIPGFFSELVQGKEIGVAMSHLPQTWPPYWPDHPNWIDENGNAEWNGYFGRGIMNADQESYFMMDDNADEKMYAIHGFLPDSTDLTRRGQGLRVSVRGMQWSNFLAQDVIFWVYEVENIGTTNYDQATFGALVGTYVGGAGSEWIDDASFFNIRESIVYSWDFDNYVSQAANPRWKNNPNEVGYIGYAFLESPGNPYDGIDNDGDNTSQANSAPFFTESCFRSHELKAGDKLILINKSNYDRTQFIMPDSTVEVVSMGICFRLVPDSTIFEEGNMILGDAGPELNPNAYDNIDNDLDGLIDENYQLHYRVYKETTDGVVLIDTLNPVQYKDYFTGAGLSDLLIDEARDDGIDNDGDWDPERDDVGADGKANTNDKGENDSMPTDGEPHFDKTDVNESDQLGLTNFDYFVPSWAIHLNNEEEMWLRMTPGRFDVPESVVKNRPIRGEDGDFVFGSGYFPLNAEKTQRFSMALVYGEDYKSVVRNRQIAQLIYDSNYNFPRPPDKPSVHAVAEEGRVILYWDRVAESSYDKVLDEYDFEGYKIYKGTDPYFSDCKTISNGYGELVDYQPYEQMDLKNGIKGFFDSDPLLYQLSSGKPYFLGNDTGIQNSFIDEDVDNGKTYYYAVCAYDRGNAAKSIYPSENNKSITMDETGKLTFDKNTVMVVPNAPVCNYEPPESSIPLERLSGTSSVTPFMEVIDPVKIEDATYFITFTDSLVRNEVNMAWAYSVIDSATNDTIILENTHWGPENGDVFKGVRLSFDTRYQNLNYIAVDTTTTRWSDTSAQNLEYVATEFEWEDVKSIKCPYDYMLVFYDEYNCQSSDLSEIFTAGSPLREKPTNFRIFDVTKPDNPIEIEYGLIDKPQHPGTISHFAILFLTVPDGSQLSWRLVFKDKNSETVSKVPAAGDTLFLNFYKPFNSQDKFVYRASKSSINYDKLSAKMKKIKVVPNPYIVTNSFEKPLPYEVRGRGERVIYFTHLPADARIYIYSADGSLVRKLRHEGVFEDGTVTWDLRTREGLDASFGVYFYIVEAGGKSKSGKLAIIK